MMDPEIISNREPPDRGPVVAKWIMGKMLAPNKRSKVIYIYILDSYIINTVPINLNCEYIFYILRWMYGAEENANSYIIVHANGIECDHNFYTWSCLNGVEENANRYITVSVPKNEIEFDHNFYPLSWMYGAEENLKYKMRKKFVRKSLASLDGGGDQHEGKVAIYDISNDCRLLFDLKYHPPEHCLREYVIISKNEVGDSTAAFASLRKSVLNEWTAVKKVRKRHVSTTPDGGQLCGASSSSEEDEKSCTTVKKETSTCPSQVIDDGGHDDVDIRRQIPLHGTLADSEVQPDDNGDDGKQLPRPVSPVIDPGLQNLVHLSAVYDAPDIIETKQYEGKKFYSGKIGREGPNQTADELRAKQRSLKQDGQLSGSVATYFAYYFAFQKLNDDVKNGTCTQALYDQEAEKLRKIKNDNLSKMNWEHHFPIEFAMLVLNFVAQLGLCDHRLVNCVFRVLNTPSNVEYIAKERNWFFANKSNAATTEIKRKFPGIWNGSFTLKNTPIEQLDKYLDDMNTSIVEKSGDDFEYFRTSWINLQWSFPHHPSCDAFVYVANRLFG